jgi:hypothetical protein
MFLNVQPTLLRVKTLPNYFKFIFPVILVTSHTKRKKKEKKNEKRKKKVKKSGCSEKSVPAGIT